jgi:hypothetical protein
MPGRIVKTVLQIKGPPPEKGSPAWLALVDRVAREVHNRQPICSLTGGRRKDGWPCESPYIRDNGRCKMHGGNQPTGAEHHNFKHGRASRAYSALPARFKAAYMASMEDDDLLSLRADISLTDARMTELIERLDTGETGERWRGVATLSGGLTSELNHDDLDRDELMVLSVRLRELSEAAISDERAWRELKSTSQHRRKLVDTERQRLKDLHAYLTAEEALAIMGRITDSIIRHVEDKAALTAILHEIQVVTGNDPRDRGLIGA